MSYRICGKRTVTRSRFSKQTHESPLAKNVKLIQEQRRNLDYKHSEFISLIIEQVDYGDSGDKTLIHEFNQELNVLKIEM